MLSYIPCDPDAGAAFCQVLVADHPNYPHAHISPEYSPVTGRTGRSVISMAQVTTSFCMAAHVNCLLRMTLSEVLPQFMLSLIFAAEPPDPHLLRQGLLGQTWHGIVHR